MKKDPIIAIIGLGYVGLPLSVAFAEKYRVIGFDIDSERVKQLKKGDDLTLEVSKKDLKKALGNNVYGLKVTDDANDILNACVYIITVPTPTDKNNQPVLTPLKKASETVGNV